MTVSVQYNKNVETEIDYFGKTIGAVRGLMLVKGVVRLFSEIGKGFGFQSSDTVTSLDKNLGTGIGALGFFRLHPATSSAFKSLGSLSDSKDGVSFQRKVIKSVGDTAEAVTAWGFIAMFVKFNPVVRTVSAVTDFVSDTADLSLVYSDYQKSAELEVQKSGVEKEQATHSKNYYYLAALKDICSIAGTVLGTGLAFAGVSWVALTVSLVAISLFTTLVAIERDLHKNMGHYEVIKFKDALV